MAHPRSPAGAGAGAGAGRGGISPATARPSPGKDVERSDTGPASRRVTVAYHDEYGVWEPLWKPFRQHVLPLHTLTWASRGGKASHTIDTLDVTFVPSVHDTVRTALLAVDWDKAPYGFVYLVKCERWDDYRNQVKPKLKAWVARATERGWHWIIVYLPLGKLSPEGTVKPKVYNKVFDKLRSEFGTPKKSKRLSRGQKPDVPPRDRCVRIDLFPHAPSTDIVVQWRKASQALKDVVVESLTSRAARYEAELRKRYDNHSVVGWNYCSYFAVKESLAFMFKQMGLREEALLQYDELNSTYYVAADPARSGAHPKGMHDRPLPAGDDEGHVLDHSRKKFREMILLSSISVVDFRQYLFAVRCELLFLLDRPTEVAASGLKFLDTIAETIDQQVVDRRLPSTRGDAWMYSAAIDITEVCQRRSVSHTPRSPRHGVASRSRLDAVRLAALLGEMLLFARARLVSIGETMFNWRQPSIAKAHFPGSTEDLMASVPSGVRTGTHDRAPRSPEHRLSDASAAFAEAAGASPVRAHRAESGADTVIAPEDVTGDPVLRSALASLTTLEDLFLWITKSSSLHFQHAGRLRFACKLDSDRAAVYVSRGDYASARQLLRHLAGRYFEKAWYELYVHAQSLIAMCDERLGDWIHYLATCLRILDPQLRDSAWRCFTPAGAGPPSSRRVWQSHKSVTAADDDTKCGVPERQRLAAFATRMCEVARGPLRLSHTRDMDPVLVGNSWIEGATPGKRARSATVGQRLTVVVRLLNRVRAPLAVDRISVSLLPTDGSQTVLSQVDFTPTSPLALKALQREPVRSPPSETPGAGARAGAGSGAGAGAGEGVDAGDPTNPSAWTCLGVSRSGEASPHSVRHWMSAAEANEDAPVMSPELRAGHESATDLGMAPPSPMTGTPDGRRHILPPDSVGSDGKSFLTPSGPGRMSGDGSIDDHGLSSSIGPRSVASGRSRSDTRGRSDSRGDWRSLMSSFARRGSRAGSVAPGPRLSRHMSVDSNASGLSFGRTMTSGMDQLQAMTVVSATGERVLTPGLNVIRLPIVLPLPGRFHTDGISASIGRMRLLDGNNGRGDQRRRHTVVKERRDPFAVLVRQAPILPASGAWTLVIRVYPQVATSIESPTVHVDTPSGVQAQLHRVSARMFDEAGVGAKSEVEVVASHATHSMAHLATIPVGSWVEVYVPLLYSESPGPDDESAADGSDGVGAAHDSSEMHDLVLSPLSGSPPTGRRAQGPSPSAAVTSRGDGGTPWHADRASTATSSAQDATEGELMVGGAGVPGVAVRVEGTTRMSEEDLELVPKLKPQLPLCTRFLLGDLVPLPHQLGLSSSSVCKVADGRTFVMVNFSNTSPVAITLLGATAQLGWHHAEAVSRPAAAGGLLVRGKSTDATPVGGDVGGAARAPARLPPHGCTVSCVGAEHMAGLALGPGEQASVTAIVEGDLAAAVEAAWGADDAADACELCTHIRIKFEAGTRSSSGSDDSDCIGGGAPGPGSVCRAHCDVTVDLPTMLPGVKPPMLVTTVCAVARVDLEGIVNVEYHIDAGASYDGPAPVVSTAGREWRVISRVCNKSTTGGRTTMRLQVSVVPLRTGSLCLPRLEPGKAAGRLSDVGIASDDEDGHEAMAVSKCRLSHTNDVFVWVVPSGM